MRKGFARLIQLPPGQPGASKQSRLREHLRDLISTGAISVGAKLPAQRMLARDLNVSRNTVVNVYEVLISEGLLEGRAGAGTFVVAGPSTAKEKRRIRRSQDSKPYSPLQQGAPDTGLFPVGEWRKVQDQVWRRATGATLRSGDAAGWSGLRLILAQRLAATRGIACSAEQVQIVANTSAGIGLISRVLGLARQKVWVEELSYSGGYAALRRGGALLVPVPTDGSGLVVPSGISAAPDARAAYVTPTTQFPTGAHLSRARSRALVEWAQRRDAWIVEDDYESEFAFEGRAPPPLAAGNGADRVIYLATLNGILFPSVQVAFIVVPDALVDRFNRARSELGDVSNTPMHMTVHDFIEKGLLAKHLRNCFEVYGHRREVLRTALANFPGVSGLAHQPMGLHATAWLPNVRIEVGLRDAAVKRGVMIHRLADCAVSPTRPRRSGFYLGFSGFAPDVIKQAVSDLSRLAEAALKRL